MRTILRKCSILLGLVGLFCLAYSSPAWSADSPLRVRAVWVPPQSFATKADADEMIARCERAGFNVLLPDVMVNQAISFRSSHYPGKVIANEDFDPLAYVVERAHERGMKVEAWVCVYYEGSQGRVSKPLHPEWLVLSMSSRPFDYQRFLSPSIPGVNKYLLAVLKDLLAYDIDGIHLDYIRYPGTTYDFSVVGRRAFKSAEGFDPLDFLDHAERIVKPDDEPYPIRVLFPDDHTEKPWETTEIERTLDQTGLGYAFITESTENIRRLRVPGLLIASSYYSVSPEMVDALADYVKRGGDLLWTDPPAATLVTSESLRELLGLRSARWTGQQRLALQPVAGHPLEAWLKGDTFLTPSSHALEPAGGVVAARLADGTPGIVTHQVGGRTVVVGPHLMKSKSPAAVAACKALITWLRTETGVSDSDPLAAKRAAWVRWRGDRVTKLVRAIHDAAKRHNPEMVVSSSGGPSPWEFYSCYRDARRWLAEGINEHVFPMNYTEDCVELENILSIQTASAPPGRKTAIYPGLQAYTEKRIDGNLETRPQDANIVARQIEIVRKNGYEGFAIFAYNTLSDEAIEAIRKAGGSDK